MYGVLKSVLNGRVDFAQADTTAASPDPDPTDPWIFTDPAALEIYQKQGRLEELEDAVCDYGMGLGQGAPEDLECKREIRRLLRERLLTARHIFGYLSPHPTVYYARGEGELNIAGQRFTFSRGDEVLYEPWLARITHPGIMAPVRIGQLLIVSNLCLCCEAFPQICIHCEKTLNMLRQPLQNRRSH